MRAAVCVAACVLLLAVCASALRGLSHIDRTAIQAMLEAEANTQVMTEAQVREQAALHAETMAAVEEEGRIEVAMWTHHMEQEHDPACVAQIFPVCRSHRDWCRQECDNKAQTDNRCLSSKCTSLFRQCHTSHVDRCEKGSAYGVHPVWKDTAKSSKKYCEVKIQEKCNAVKEVCNRKCDGAGQSCHHDKCTKIHSACHNMHKNTCGDPLWITPRLPHHQENSKEFQKNPKSESSESGSSESSKQKWGSESGEPKLRVQAKDVTSEVSKKVDGYIACEETVAKRCEVETKQCVRTCAAQNADSSLGKCDPEKCYRMHEECSDKYSLECESPKAKAVDAEELPAGQHFCSQEDPACGSIRPDIVHKLNCTLENDFCLNVAKSHVSSCEECEQRKLSCYNSCRDRTIKFASNSPTTKGRCTARRCMEEFNLCHELRCEAKKADLVEAEEVPEGSTAKQRMVEQLRRERDAEAFFKSEQKKSIEAGVCGDGVRQPGEECDGGAGCDLRCLCGAGFKKKKDGTDCVRAGPSPCSFLKSGCLYGQGQTNPTIVPHGSLYNYDQGEIVVRAAPQQY